MSKLESHLAFLTDRNSFRPRPRSLAVLFSDAWHWRRTTQTRNHLCKQAREIWSFLATPGLTPVQEEHADTDGTGLGRRPKATVSMPRSKPVTAGTQYAGFICT